MSHTAPLCQDKNKTALIVFAANVGNSIYRNFEGTAVVYQK